MVELELCPLEVGIAVEFVVEAPEVKEAGGVRAGL
jgi:hypothetical protein